MSQRTQPLPHTRRAASFSIPTLLDTLDASERVAYEDEAARLTLAERVAVAIDARAGHLLDDVMLAAVTNDVVAVVTK